MNDIKILHNEFIGIYENVLSKNECKNIIDLFEDDLNKQLAHYEALRTIQLFYGKSTIETDKQIKKTKEDLNKEAYQKELDILNAQYVGFENDLVKQQEYNKKKLELQKTYG